MTYKLSTTAYLGKVVLKVNDLAEMTQFYTDMIGLDVLESEGNTVDLGIKADGTYLVRLEELAEKVPAYQTTGLYHLAFLLPERADLAHNLKHLVENRVQLDGASDHGYSEAIYLNDPEWNGIEIYADKNRSEWDIRLDGTIGAVTEPMDLPGVMASGQKKAEPDPYKMPSGTIMGHVHLSVADINDSQSFFEDVLGFDLKLDFHGQAKFYAAGGYHHHIGSNAWVSKNAPAPQANHRGLKYYEVITDNFTDFIPHLDEIGYDYKKLSETAVELVGPNGIAVHVLAPVK